MSTYYFYALSNKSLKALVSSVSPSWEPCRFDPPQVGLKPPSLLQLKTPWLPSHSDGLIQSDKPLGQGKGQNRPREGGWWHLRQTHQGRVGGIASALGPHQLQGLQVSTIFKGHQEASAWGWGRGGDSAQRGLGMVPRSPLPVASISLGQPKNEPGTCPPPFLFPVPSFKVLRLG